MANRIGTPTSLNELITHIQVERLSKSYNPLYRNETSRFTFHWSTFHWRKYKEIDYIPNVYYYQLDVWESIFRIANGTDPITFTLFYMNQEQGEHIPFIAKLMLNHGAESVKFVFIDKPI